MSKKIAIGGDHAGFQLKEKIAEFLINEGHEVKDFGPYSEASADYPDFVHPVCESIENGEYHLGILMCGSGQGVTITANKHQNIRASLCWDTDLAAITRKHNDANVLCMAARWTAVELAKSIVKEFLSNEFEGGRHANRVNKISCQ